MTDGTQYRFHVLDDKGIDVQGDIRIGGNDAVKDTAPNTTVIGGGNSTVFTGHDDLVPGNNTATSYGVALAGFESEATALGTDGLAFVRSGNATSKATRGIAITGNGIATGAELAMTRNGGHAIAYGATIAIAINAAGSWDATAQAGAGGLLIFGYHVGTSTKYVTHTVTAAEENLSLVLDSDLTVRPATTDFDP